MVRKKSIPMTNLILRAQMRFRRHAYVALVAVPHVINRKHETISSWTRRIRYYLLLHVFLRVIYQYKASSVTTKRGPQHFCGETETKSSRDA